MRQPFELGGDDGAARSAEVMTPSIFSGVCTRIKILAQMEFAERRLP